MLVKRKRRKASSRRLRQRGGLFAATGARKSTNRRLLSMGIRAGRKATRLGKSALRLAKKRPRLAAGLGLVSVGALGIAARRLGR